MNGFAGIKQIAGFPRKVGIFFIMTAFAFLLCAQLFGIRAYAAARLLTPQDPVVVVIDPGHGGENSGTLEGRMPEKEMTLITSQALAEHLRKFEGVTVYLTRSGDGDMSLAERAEFAEEAGADFLFSIHYNASVSHEQFGSEVWTSVQTPMNAHGYQFGMIQMRNMEARGLFLRGVKTRFGHDGVSDYYGILRQCSLRQIPSVIIEHCCVDEPGDAALIETDDQLREFGIADADSIARYFGLRSTQLGIDYSGDDPWMMPADPSVIQPLCLRDATPPEEVTAEILEADYEGCSARIRISAAEGDGLMEFYSLSLDGGRTFQKMAAWPRVDIFSKTCAESFELSLEIPSGTRPVLLVRGYNQYETYTESEPVAFSSLFLIPGEAAESTVHAPIPDREPEAVTETEAVPKGPDITIGGNGADSFSVTAFLLGKDRATGDDRSAAIFRKILLTAIFLTASLEFLIFIIWLVQSAIRNDRRK